MNTEKSLQRLVWRFSQQKAFTPNANDIEALNTLIEWINKEHADRLQNNHHYAKLFMVLYIEFLNHYDDINFAQKEVVKLLKTPLKEYYSKFYSTVNTKKFLEAAKFVGIKDELNINGEEKYWSIDKMKQTISENENIVRDNQDVLIKALETYSLTEVTNKLNYIIAESLHKYEDL